MKQSALNLEQKPVRILMTLAWPSIVEQLLITMVSYVDTAMVGSLGAGATAAIAVNASTTWLIGGILTAMGVGFSVQVAYYAGAGDASMVRRILDQAVIAVLVFGLFMMAVGLVLSGFLPGWMGASKEILQDAKRYIRIYMLSLVFQCSSGVFSAILRCTGDTRTPMLLNTGTNLLNVILNYFLIFPRRLVHIGSLSIPVWGAGWGVAGAAAASTIAMTITGTALLLIVYLRKGPYRIRLTDNYRPDRVVLKKAVSLSLPAAFERLIMSGGQIYMTRLVSSLGTVALAANHVAVTAEGISYMPATGISFAATALVGQSLGAGDDEKAQRFGSLAGWSGFLLSSAMGLLLFLFAVPLASLFSSDPQVIRVAAKMLRIVSFSEPFFGLSIVLSGALRGGGDTRYPFYVSLICMLGIRGVLAPILIFGFKMNLEAVWIAMVADLYARGILCFIRFRSGKWKSMKLEQSGKESRA